MGKVSKREEALVAYIEGKREYHMRYLFETSPEQIDFNVFQHAYRIHVPKDESGKLGNKKQQP